MNRAQQELDRMRAEALGELARDVQRAGKRVGEIGSACVRQHPLLAMGGGALLGALVVSRLRRPAAPHAAEPVHEPEPESKEKPDGHPFGYLTSALVLVGRNWLEHTLAAVTQADEKRAEEDHGDEEEEEEDEDEDEDAEERTPDEAARAAQRAADLEERESLLTG